MLITEIGGITGDIKGLPFLKQSASLPFDMGFLNVIFIHVTYVPYIRTAGELKTKPTQQSVAKLREIGITPFLFVVATDHLIRTCVKRFRYFVMSQVAVVEERYEHSIYEVPLMLSIHRTDCLQIVEPRQ